MTLLQLLKRNLFLILFLLIVVFYMIYYGPVGYDDADRGYTLALSWRIFNGELPYKDFFSIKPPLTPYFHLVHFLLPDKYQMLSERGMFYILLASSSLFGALIIKNVFSKDEINVNAYLLASTGFVYSATSFPATSWHAVDAVFFASAGLFLLVRYRTLTGVTLGMTLLFLSALCKQPFYLMPFVGILWVILVSKNAVKVATSILTLVLLLSGFVALLYFSDMLDGWVFRSDHATLFG